jgi:hypothetical protein
MAMVPIYHAQIMHQGLGLRRNSNNTGDRRRVMNEDFCSRKYQIVGNGSGAIRPFLPEKIGMKLRERSMHSICSRYLLAILFIFSLSVSAHAEQWKQSMGKGYIICDAIHKRLNSYQWTQDQTYDYLWSVVVSYPGWKEPAWEELNPQEHKELIKELIKYDEWGSDYYFKRTDKPENNYNSAMIEEYFQNTMKSDVQLRILRAHLLDWFDLERAPAGDQTFVQLRYKMEPEEEKHLHEKHPDKPIVKWGTRTFLVTEDLHGPDPRLGKGYASNIIGSPVLLFGGRPHFIVGSGISFDIYRDFGTGMHDFCRFSYNLTGK